MFVDVLVHQKSAYYPKSPPVINPQPLEDDDNKISDAESAESFNMISESVNSK